MKPADLLDCQRDLQRRLGDRQFGGHLMSQVAGQEGSTLRDVLNGRGPQWVRNVPALAAEGAASSLLYDVVKPMAAFTLWMAAANHHAVTFGDVVPPSPTGLVHIDGGIPIEDSHGAVLVIDWLLWFPIPSDGVATGFFLLPWNDAFDNPDASTLTWRAKEPAALVECVGRWEATGFLTALPKKELGPALLSADSTWDPAGSQTIPSGSLLRFVHALWSVMREPVVALEESRVDRATAKRMRRAQLPETVTTVTLRHLVQAGDPRGVKEWQHHWVVRGHYRNQACGPGRQDRRLVYIAPHVKGNQDGPLLETKKVHRLVR